MPNRLALLFPGQGCQYVGMGRDLYERFPEARALFDEADELLGFNLSKLCFEGPEADLRDTVNTQPAVLTMSLATLHALKAQHDLDGVSFVAGHSLGEYSALVAGGSVSFSDAVRLVRERGRLMTNAGQAHPGGMAAVLGLEAEVVDRTCQQAAEETGTVVQVANYNSPGQIVISGERRGLDKAMELARSIGARRVVPLAVSIASHSPLMKTVADGLRQAVESALFREATVPVVANVTAKPLSRPGELRDELVEQLTSPVQWVDSVRFMLSSGVTSFVEVGPKDVLGKLMKRIDPKAERTSVGDVTGITQWAT